MSWNYRVVKRTDNGLDSYCIHEAYYDDGVPTSISHHHVAPYGETQQELVNDITNFMSALKKPVLLYGDFDKDTND